MIDEKLLYQELGERIRKMREAGTSARGRMTQAQLALQVGLERTSITNIEKGNQKVPLHVLFRICEVLKVPVTDALPEVPDVQASDELMLEAIEFAGETRKVPSSVAQALANLLNPGGADGTLSK